MSTRRRPSSTTSSAPPRRTRPSTGSRTSRRSARRSSATRRARPWRSRPRAARSSTRSSRSRRRRQAPSYAALELFERFTERARQVVVLAQDEARAFVHNYIGTEHLLLGLLREEEGVAARVLEALDVSLEEVRAEVARIIGSGEELATGQIPFTPRGKKVLELALREALSLGHNHIGTEHILLGLVREGEGVAMRILHDLDVDAEKIREWIVGKLGQAPPPPDPIEALAPDLRTEVERVR